MARTCGGSTRQASPQKRCSAVFYCSSVLWMVCNTAVLYQKSRLCTCSTACPTAPVLFFGQYCVDCSVSAVLHTHCFHSTLKQVFFSTYCTSPFQVLVVSAPFQVLVWSAPSQVFIVSAPYQVFTVSAPFQVLVISAPL